MESEDLPVFKTPGHLQTRPPSVMKWEQGYGKSKDRRKKKGSKQIAVDFKVLGIIMFLS